jgi:uncharacterized repeat protein (TIGR04076 family)
MPFKVKCTLVSFTGDPEYFPCHFNYEIGDEFTYDGEKFEGKICNGLLKNMAPVIWNTVFYGRGDYDRMVYLYSGLSARAPEMKKYDGVGFRPLKETPEGVDPRFLGGMPSIPPENLIKRQRGFTCDDTRTGAHFTCEPVDLARGGDMLTYYNRAMSILEKVKEQPGMTVNEILGKYTDFEREEIYPPIYDLNVSLMLDEMAVVGYVDIIDGKTYAK